MRDFKNEKEDSALWKHSLLEHGGQKQSFIMKTLRSFTSALQRQVNEAVRITSMRAEIVVMNSKNKWHQAPIVRVVASIGLHGDQGEDQAPTLADRGGGGRAGRGGRGTGRGGRRAQGTS